MNNYFQANIALLDPVVRRELFVSSRPIYTKVRDCAPALHGIHADVTNSLIADGTNIQGTVRNSILFRNVKVDRDAVVENCVLMQGTLISESSSLNCVVTDKNVVVKDNRTLHRLRQLPGVHQQGNGCLTGQKETSGGRFVCCGLLCRMHDENAPHIRTSIYRRP